MAGNYAIVVGLNSYPGITPLLGPENDARWFHKWLLDNSLVEEEDAKLIVSSGFKAESETINAQPDTMAVDRAFERLLHIGHKKEKVGKRLYLFFSGHGFGPTINDAALLMANCDSKMGFTGHYVNAVMYADFFVTANYFDEIVLFMDCCRDDLWRAPNRIPPWQSLRNVEAGNVKKFYGLATKWAQKAREAPTPEGTVHGYFTRALKAAFEGGAVDKSKRLSTSTVMDFTLNYVQGVIKPELAQKNLKAPEPEFPEKDDFVIATGLTPKLTPVSITFSPASQATKSKFVLTGGAAKVMLPNSTGADPWTHELGFGNYAVFDATGELVKEFVAFGEKVSLSV